MVIIIFIFILLNFVSYVISAGSPGNCSINNSKYYSNWLNNSCNASNGNNTSNLCYYFIKDVYISSCEPINCSSLRNLWKTNGINLTGFDCEHIIDTNNSPNELASCSKNIRGNLIPTISSWNRGMGQKCWSQVEKEKSTIYGDIFILAYNTVKNCCQDNISTPEIPSKTQEILSESSANNIWYMTIPILFGITVIIGMCIYYHQHKKQANGFLMVV